MVGSLKIKSKTAAILVPSKRCRQNKSEVAAAAALDMNPDLHIEAEVKSRSWNQVFLTMRRLFEMDSDLSPMRSTTSMLVPMSTGAVCSYKKPLLESGTLGARGKYSPLYPTWPNHTPVQWSTRSWFRSVLSGRFLTKSTTPIAWAKVAFSKAIFADLPETVNLYLVNQNYVWANSQTESWYQGHSCLISWTISWADPILFDDCICLACTRFEEKNSPASSPVIIQLSRRRQILNGAPFCLDPRAPKHLWGLDINNPDHLTQGWWKH